MRKLFLMLMLVLGATISAQTQASVADARQFLDLLRQGKFPEATQRFDTRMAASLPPDALRQAWSALGAQAGEFKNELSQGSEKVAGMTVVTLGLQFEKAALNMVVSFDAANRISGLGFTPRPPEASAVPLPQGLTEESFTVGAGRFALPGTLTLPSGTERVPGVVLVHGSGPQDRDETIGPNKPFRDLAWGLAARGIAVLRYEKRTKQHAGAMSQDLSITVHEETIEDAVLAEQGLRRHPRVDANHVFILGHSLGAMVAPRIGQEDRAIAGLILLAGNSRPLTELVIEQTEYLASLAPNPATQGRIAAIKAQVARVMDPALPLNTPAAVLLGAPAAYWKDLNAYQPGAVAASLAMPMLILQGERDYQVTMKDFEGWRDALKGRTNVTFKSYSDLNHLFITGAGKSTPAEYEKPGSMSEAVINDIATWVKAR
jgi:dienelactone hydrolase